MITRSICPQVAGLYRSNRHEGRYSFLYVPDNNPDSEWYTMDAYLCDKYGNVKQDTQHPIVVEAKDFGDFYEF